MVHYYGLSKMMVMRERTANELDQSFFWFLSCIRVIAMNSWRDSKCENMLPLSARFNFETREPSRTRCINHVKILLLLLFLGTSTKFYINI